MTTRRFVTAALLLAGIALSVDISARAASEPIPDCTPFSKIGSVPLYRCPDLDYNILCYVNMAAAGVMTCVEQP